MSLSLSTPCVPAPTLHFLCGKIGAGKSTLAAELASGPGTMLLSEDRWLAALYPGEILDVADYGRCAARLRNAIGEHPSVHHQRSAIRRDHRVFRGTGRGRGLRHRPPRSGRRGAGGPAMITG